MKVGDTVRVLAQRNSPVGIFVDVDPCGWYWVLTETGKLVVWPKNQLQLLEQDELTDKQLEEVRGGMSAQRFELWRMETINEI